MSMIGRRVTWERSCKRLQESHTIISLKKRT